MKAGDDDAFPVTDLTEADLAAIEWSGRPSHIQSVAALVGRVPSGDVEYLALRTQSGEPVSKLCIDYVEHEGAGTLMQLATRDDLQRRGLATRLIAAAEDRIRVRGLGWALLGVEADNPRARMLYERLGYALFRRQPASWEQEDENGNVSLYETEVLLLRKEL